MRIVSLYKRGLYIIFDLNIFSGNMLNFVNKSTSLKKVKS